MIINFQQLASSEVKSSTLFYDLGDIEYIINEQLKDESFTGIQQFNVLLHTYCFNGPFAPFFDPISKKKGYKTIGQIYHITKGIDYSHISRLDKQGQHEEVKRIILEAIEGAKKSQGRLKDMDFDKLYRIVSQAITNDMYIEEELICDQMY